MKTIIYNTRGTCSRMIEVTGDNGTVVDVKFFGGCHGNLQGIGKLVKGMKYEDVINRLNNISCNGKPTSCPDQLCRAIEQLMAEENR
ncbi:MAG: TIGR03905 family TSCPD domain-containing protein [Bacteroidaceae bacterium]|nr:TIGR03905 family TSCPD domain-containing protein [Bacteroidaceae bacterium]